MYHRYYSSLLALAVSLLVFNAGAAQEKTFTPEELTIRAEVVAVGKVTSMRSDWNASRTRIFTDVTISVDEYLKGEQSQTMLTLTVPGGEVGEVGEAYSHVARFQNNEEVVVFVERDTRGVLRLTAGKQSKLTITSNERTGRKMIAGDKTLDMLRSQVRRTVDQQLKNR
ncbi:MAG: hypothetical protein ACKVRP_09810 [Bacteroidota bacterium]